MTDPKALAAKLDKALNRLQKHFAKSGQPLPIGPLADIEEVRVALMTEAQISARRAAIIERLQFNVDSSERSNDVEGRINLTVVSEESFWREIIVALEASDDKAEVLERLKEKIERLPTKYATYIRADYTKEYGASIEKKEVLKFIAEEEQKKK